jgi:hypothetical protein
MFSKTLDQIGDWNPQLFRELKGNLKARNIILTAIVTLTIQFMIVSMFSNTKCLNYDEVASICRQSEWVIEWKYLFRAFNYIIPLVAYLGGVYQLVSDLSKEQSRGTLNFIRLTPQSSYKILLGKILGVPTLVYLGILTCIPLHFLAGIASNISIFWLLGMYSLWLIGGLLFAISAMFYTLLISGYSNSNTATTSINGLGCIITFFLGIPYAQMIDFSHQLYYPELYNNYNNYGDLNWFTWFLLPLEKPAITCFWLIISIGVLTYWLWEGVNRYFNNPNKTPLSKIQGYGLMSCFQLWLLGFLIPSYEGGIKSEHFSVGIGFIFFLIPISYLILIVALTPHRQTLLDWARYRHQMNNPQYLWQDLLTGEKSPAIIAIFVNALISIILWTAWALLIPKESNFDLDELTIPKIIFALFLTVAIGLIYALILQLCLLMKTSKRVIMGSVILSLVIITPLVLGGIFAANPAHFNNINLIWAFSPMPFLVLMEGGISSALVGFCGQILILSFLTQNLTRKLQKAGQSETKVLLTQS